MTAVHSTLQSVFNTAWHEFVVNNRSRAARDGVCLYRGGDRDPKSVVRCIIGVCIPDDLYEPKLEHNTIGTIFNNMPTWYKRLFNSIDVDALIELQSIHDDNFDDIREQLIQFALDYNLQCPAIATK